MLFQCYSLLLRSRFLQQVQHGAYLFIFLLWSAGFIPLGEHASHWVVKHEYVADVYICQRRGQTFVFWQSSMIIDSFPLPSNNRRKPPRYRSSSLGDEPLNFRQYGSLVAWAFVYLPFPRVSRGAEQGMVGKTISLPPPKFGVRVAFPFKISIVYTYMYVLFAHTQFVWTRNAKSRHDTCLIRFVEPQRSTVRGNLSQRDLPQSQSE